MFRKALKRCALASSVLVLIGCASYQTKVDEARRLLRTDPVTAVTKLEPLAKENSRDQLVYVLDYATALQAAGRYEESARSFLEAERLADLQDYHSISKVTGSLLLSEEMVQYKGDDFEKVLIPGMNALNYLSLGQQENAMTQARRVNELLTKLRIDEKKDFNQSPYAFYLSAMLYEADKDFDNALILYKKALEFSPQFEPLKSDLLRTAIRAQRSDELEKFRARFPEVTVRPEWKDRKSGEIVLIFPQGWGPRKAPRPGQHRFPMLVPVHSSIRGATLLVEEVDGKTGPIATETSVIESVQDVAIKALEGDFGRLFASRMAGIATKAVVSDQIRQKNEALGQLAWIAMNIADRADLRQWSTLPETFQIGRVEVKPGNYKITVRPNGGDSSLTLEKSVQIKPGKKEFIVWRVYE